ncbi:Zn-ribbon domain-containing OB-fold protein [Actinomadura alba]|uniref:OB-fold domain-containing protein n=1 Tax=Actinomadura alba TaxID=406431 RepID=A0ABR7LWC4_9ACTN|nr:OB-fold domain-containing protein [Actinomadura alba]MBC6469147.1 OB-fold domain-containing protein [Actinomadura alba]
MTDTGFGVLRRDGRTDAFFDGAAADQLMIKWCPACDRWFAPDASGCTDCGGPELVWARAGGQATLVSWAVSHARPRDDGSPAPAPAMLALVELAEGPWLHARLDGVDAGLLREGLPLAAAFEHPGEGEAYLVFRPTTGEEPADAHRGL